MNAQVEGLRRALRLRLRALELAIEDATSRSTRRGGARIALAILARYPPWVAEFIDQELSDESDDRSNITFLGQIAHDVGKKTRFVDDWFGSDDLLDIPSALASAVRHECNTLGLGDRHALLAIGTPGNFITAEREFEEMVFGGIDRDDRPVDLPDAKFAMIQIPRLEGTSGLWWPVVIGHELAHLRAGSEAALSLHLRDEPDWSLLNIDPIRSARALDLANAWATELICDAYCVHRFGPGGVAAMVEMLDVRGATQRFSKTHPPAWLRVRTMRSQLGDLSASCTDAVMAHADAMCMTPQPTDPEYSHMDRVIPFLEGLRARYVETVESWAPRYELEEHEARIAEAASDFEEGIPAQLTGLIDDTDEFVEADICNAAWLAWTRDTAWPVSKLLTKALDDTALVRLWRAHGGTLGAGDQSHSNEEAGERTAYGAITREGIIDRLQRGRNDGQRLVVTPLLEQSMGVASLDIRLGNKFIVFQRSATPSIRTFDRGWDSRTVQRKVEISWSDRFVLHPNELVLASTLEYIVMPSDLSGQVVTRSSYGRLGLICATAVQVHPYYKGCLTLELVNLGVVPLELAPMEAIAQLVFYAVNPSAHAPDNVERSCPTGPEFSRPYRETHENEVLERVLNQSPPPPAD